VLWRVEQGQRGRLGYHLLNSDPSSSAFQAYSTEKLKSSTEQLHIIEGEV